MYRVDSRIGPAFSWWTVAVIDSPDSAHRCASLASCGARDAEARIMDTESGETVCYSAGEIVGSDYLNIPAIADVLYSQLVAQRGALDGLALLARLIELGALPLTDEEFTGDETTGSLWADIDTTAREIADSVTAGMPREQRDYTFRPVIDVPDTLLDAACLPTAGTPRETKKREVISIPLANVPEWMRPQSQWPPFEFMPTASRGEAIDAVAFTQESDAPRNLYVLPPIGFSVDVPDAPAPAPVASPADASAAVSVSLTDYQRSSVVRVLSWVLRSGDFGESTGDVLRAALDNLSAA